MHKVTVIATHTDAAGFSHLVLPRPGGLAYRPGQYVTLGAHGEAKPKFLAIASHASEAELRFILRDNPWPQHTMLHMSDPMGNGFACDFSEPKPFLFLTHGTGISAIRPALLSRRNSADVLLYGAKKKEAEPGLDCLAEGFGIRQLRAYSASQGERVQAVLEKMDLAAFGAIVIVGSKEMMADCREIFSRRGFPAENIFSNF